MTTLPARAPRRQWPVPTGLIILSLVPVAGGASRMSQLIAGAAVTEENARFVASPVPVVIHIVSATMFCLLGALQFVPKLRQRRAWHRISGRLLVPLGLAVAGSGLWMSVFYPDAPGDGLPLRIIRLFVASGMLVSIWLGFTAARRRDFRSHRAWMMRGYALGLGAGTQVFTHVPYALLVGVPAGNTRAVLMAAGWVINLAVVEWLLWRSRRPSARARARVADVAELAERVG